MTGDPRPQLPPGSLLVDAGELERLLDSGASRTEIREWLREAARSQDDDHKGGADAGRDRAPGNRHPA